MSTGTFSNATMVLDITELIELIRKNNSNPTIINAFRDTMNEVNQLLVTHATYVGAFINDIGAQVSHTTWGCAIIEVGTIRVPVTMGMLAYVNPYTNDSDFATEEFAFVWDAIVQRLVNFLSLYFYTVARQMRENIKFATV